MRINIVIMLCQMRIAVPIVSTSSAKMQEYMHLATMLIFVFAQAKDTLP